MVGDPVSGTIAWARFSFHFIWAFAVYFALHSASTFAYFIYYLLLIKFFSLIELWIESWFSNFCNPMAQSRISININEIKWVNEWVGCLLEKTLAASPSSVLRDIVLIIKEKGGYHICEYMLIFKPIPGRFHICKMWSVFLPGKSEIRSCWLYNFLTSQVWGRKWVWNGCLLWCDHYHFKLSSCETSGHLSGEE